MRFLSALSDLMVPVLIFYVVGLGLLMKQDVFGDFLNGAKDGMRTVIGIVPTLIGLMAAVGCAAVIGISGGFWKTARNGAGTGGDSICPGAARGCAPLFQQCGGEFAAGSLQRGGV